MTIHGNGCVFVFDMNFSFAAKQVWGNHVFSYSSQIRGFNPFMIWLLAWNLGHAWLRSTVTQLSFKFGIQYVLSSCQRFLWDEPVFCGFGDVISSSSFGSCAFEFIWGLESICWLEPMLALDVGEILKHRAICCWLLSVSNKFSQRVFLSVMGKCLWVELILQHQSSLQIGVRSRCVLIIKSLVRCWIQKWCIHVDISPGMQMVKRNMSNLH